QAFGLQGYIYYTNSPYQVILGKNVVASGISVGDYVNANFNVPYIPSGSYNLALKDVKLNVDSTGTTPVSFQVLTGYYINAVPSQTQEGSSVALTLSITGGNANTAYV